MALIQEILVPLLAVNDTTLTVVEISLASGSKVSKGDLIMVFETSKTTYDVEAQTDGYIQYLCEADRDYEVNAVVAKIFSEVGEAAVAPVIGPAASAAPRIAATVTASPSLNGHVAAAHWEGETIFSYEADALIVSSGIDKNVFRGRDFVSVADVRGLLKPAAPKAPAVASAPAASVDPGKAIVERLSSAKKREIEYLSDVQRTGLTSTINTYVEVEGIFTHLNPALKYLKDSLLPVIIYETSRLLADYPLLNAWSHGDGVAVYREVNPGFAIDIDKGLKVVKIAGAGAKSIGEIENDILQLSGSYLDDTLKLEDLTDITFTITDLSAEGVAFFRPLVNKMNSAILGVSAIDGKLQRVVLSLTFDHRVTEGKLAARFLKELKERLESYRPADGAVHQDISCFKCYRTLREDLGGAGFMRCVTPEGKDGYICQACLKGF
ncbi:MAG TPA: 2-oxo acid dehydrogenase subunit E2 [Puia sp.]|jgi:pyruvate/2-oxoglutarate dehydrogenase complex dihydrolipoamide acyltransferase (E2) component|nr:2-oxo acid dehydrogenase subunit E2 [Puia sp.]